MGGVEYSRVSKNGEWVLHRGVRGSWLKSGIVTLLYSIVLYTSNVVETRNQSKYHTLRRTSGEAGWRKKSQILTNQE